MIKVTGNKRMFRGRKLTGVSKQRIHEARQAQKRSTILNKYREEPIYSTVLRSGAANVGMMRLSDIIEHNRKVITAIKTPEKKNWFMSFLDRARERLYDPNNEIMFAILTDLNYNRIKTMVKEAEYDTHN